MSFTVVTFYTEATPYQDLLEPWVRSLRAHGVTSFVAESMPKAGNWEQNTNLKPEAIRRAWQTLDEPIVWLDIDAELRKRPDLFWSLAETDTDFGCHYRNRGGRPELLSGTLYFGQTQKAGEILDHWCVSAARNQFEWDQRNLQTVIRSLGGIKAAELPPEYCAIDFMNVADPVVFHKQASRTLRRRV